MTYTFEAAVAANQNHERGTVNPKFLQFDEGVSFISWVEANAKNPLTATSLEHEFEEKLRFALNKEEIYDEVNETTGVRKLYPNREDAAVVYLVKASLSYLQCCQRQHNQPQECFSKWLTGEGKLWAVNDALPQTLAKAMHSYSHASADYKGKDKRKNEQEMLQTLAPV